MLKRMNVQAYRFSIAWSRVLPGKYKNLILQKTYKRRSTLYNKTDVLIIHIIIFLKKRVVFFRRKLVGLSFGL